MKEYLITTSSTVDISRKFLEEKNIPFVKFHFEIDGKEYFDDIWQSMSYDEFYKKIKNGSSTKTSQVNVNEYIEFFTPYLEKGLDILHIELSSGISGSYNSLRVAKDELMKKYPNSKLLIIDSLAASSGFGLLVDTMVEMKENGSTIEEVRDWVEENKLSMHHWFFSTNLEHYFKGGRISKTAFIVGNLLSIFPILNVSNEGKLVVRKKVHGKKNLFKEMLKKMEENALDGLDYSGKCFMCQSFIEEDSKLLAKMIEDKFPKLRGKVVINNIGTTIGSHTGCGTVAVFFYGKKRVD